MKFLFLRIMLESKSGCVYSNEAYKIHKKNNSYCALCVMVRVNFFHRSFALKSIKNALTNTCGVDFMCWITLLADFVVLITRVR